MSLLLPGRFLVRGPYSSNSNNNDISSSLISEQENNNNNNDYYKLLISDISLSFWGGIDPITGIVIDTSHPLCGQCVTDTILCIPSGRGSCTASQVLLELILNNKAPAAIVLRDVDGLVCVGAIIAQEILFHNNNDYNKKKVLDIICIGNDAYNTLLQSRTVATSGRITKNGGLVLGSDDSEMIEEEDIGNIIDDTVILSNKEQSMIDACTTEAEKMALRVIFRYTHIISNTDNRSYIPISSSHIDGCTYIGPGGIEFVQHLVQNNGYVKVPTTLNSGSTDRIKWKYYNVPEDYANNAITLGNAYIELGCIPSFTCAPYLLDNQPKFNQNIAWGESNAVVYANSVLGARTEKYADYLDICCAITGIVPQIGMHITNNRIPTIILDATGMLKEILLQKDNNDIDILFPTLGHLCGTLSDGKVPILLGFEEWNNIITTDHLKAFCAAFGTTASSPLIHIAGITPEVKDKNVIKEYISNCKDNVIEVTMKQLQNTYEILDDATKQNNNNEKVDLIALGNPHLSISECRDISNIIEKTIMNNNNQQHATTKSRIIACMSRTVHEQVNPKYIYNMKLFGIEFIFDTCWCMLLNEPIIPTNKTSATILTNSGKYAHYGPGLTQCNFRYGSMYDCINAAITGVYPRQKTRFLFQKQQQQQKRGYFTSSMSTSTLIHQKLIPLLRRWR